MQVRKKRSLSDEGAAEGLLHPRHGCRHWGRACLCRLEKTAQNGEQASNKRGADTCPTACSWHHTSCRPAVWHLLVLVDGRWGRSTCTLPGKDNSLDAVEAGTGIFPWHPASTHWWPPSRQIEQMPGPNGGLLCIPCVRHNCLSGN